MTPFLIYIFQSTFCISIFCVLYRLFLRNESSFSANRIILLSLTLFSLLIPVIPLNLTLNPIKTEALEPVIKALLIPPKTIVKEINSDGGVAHLQNGIIAKLRSFSILPILYYSGLMISIILLIVKSTLLLRLLKKSKVIKKDGYNLIIRNQSLPSFAFLCNIFISQEDFNKYGRIIIQHEKSHIHQFHYLDLIIWELVKTIHWFNPFAYLIHRYLKELHEFQADYETLRTGIDPIQYKLLLIEKGIKQVQYSPTNSFSYCQTKKRIAMINNPQIPKFKPWNILVFLPALILLILLFGNSEKVNSQNSNNRSSITDSLSTCTVRQWNEDNFNNITQKEIEQHFFSGHGVLTISMKMDGQIFIQGTPSSLKGVTDSIVNYLSYMNPSSYHIHFNVKGRQFSENGKSLFLSDWIVVIRSDKSAPSEQYLALLSTVGNTWEKIRNNYAMVIYNSPTSSLSDYQLKRIEELLPMPIYKIVH